MVRLKFFVSSIFLLSVIVAIASGPLKLGTPLYLQAFLLYLIFTTLYSHLRAVVKTGKVNIDYSISYGLSFALFAGPLGLFLFELINRFYVYFYRVRKKIADEDEFLHTFYNIGGPVLLHSLGYYLFFMISPLLDGVPFGYWGLLILIVAILDLISSLLLIVIFRLSGNISTKKEAIDFIKSNSFLDTMKKAFSNGLLYVFLIEQQWEILIALFILNYLVSKSAVLKSESMQHKIERDRFEQMAYTDFLTKVPNRTFMNKVMGELNDSGENLAIIVTDIDSFKRINDAYNHAVGDTVIQHFANTIKNCLHEDDYLFRSGGEEFTIILRNRNFEQCNGVIQSLQNEIERSPAFVEYKSEKIAIPCTASFGLYYYNANKQMEIKKAYVHADDLLYKAKNAGKNQAYALNSMIDKSVNYSSTL